MKLFKKLSGKHWPPKSVDIPVMMGRTLHIPQATKYIACMDFKSLCDSAVGAADYIALAHKFHTIIIKDIPHMSLEERPQLRRFITLIDELYQNNVKLICSAETTCDKLYSDNQQSVYDEVFAFDRCASRLNEMQTVKYLQRLHVLQKPKLNKNKKVDEKAK